MGERNGGTRMHERRSYYTIDEANSLIPRLELLFAELGRIQNKVNELSRRARELGIELGPDEAAGETETTGHPVAYLLHRQFRRLSEEYAGLLDEIHALGVVIEDLDHGIVSIYSWLGRDEILLSWQYGENEVRHWHAVGEDAEHRRPLVEEALGPEDSFLH